VSEQDEKIGPEEDERVGPGPVSGAAPVPTTAPRIPVRLLSTAGALLVAGCLALAFLLCGRFYLRLDLSQGGLYSLSAGSKKLLQRLQEPIEVQAYFSKELPPQYAAQRSYTKDLLREYQAASKGKLRFSFVDLEKEDDARQEAAREGIAPIQFNVISKEKYEVREGFMGLTLKRGGKKEVLPVVTDSAGLEYEISSRILRLIREKREVVGFVSSHGSLAPGRLHPRLREFLERNYELRGIDLSGIEPGTTVSADVVALAVLGVNSPLDDHALYALDQFLMSGRPMAFGVDVRKVDLQSFYASDMETGLRPWLLHNGIRFKNNFVLDLQSQKVQLSQRRGWFTVTNIVDFPLLVMATDLDREHPATKHLESLSFPFACPIEASTRTAQGSLRVLARSSKMSWIRSDWAKGGFQSINPVQNLAPTSGDPKGPFALSVVIEDRFRSWFDAGQDAAHPLPKDVPAESFIRSSTAPVRLLVAGSSRFADPQLPPGDSGPAFLLNLVDWLAMDADLIGIRSKGAVFRPLRELPASRKALVRWVNMLLPVLLVLAFGLFRLARRRAHRARRAVAYRLRAAVPEESGGAAAL